VRKDQKAPQDSEEKSENLTRFQIFKITAMDKLEQWGELLMPLMAFVISMSLLLFQLSSLIPQVLSVGLLLSLQCLLLKVICHQFRQLWRGAKTSITNNQQPNRNHRPSLPRKRVKEIFIILLKLAIELLSIPDQVEEEEEEDITSHQETVQPPTTFSDEPGFAKMSLETIVDGIKHMF
jgi:hypothetical protein